MALGNIKLFEHLSIDAGSLAADAEAGRTRADHHVRGDRRQGSGLIGAADPIKDSTEQAIRDLHDEGVMVVMLTGDNRTTARVVADKLGIDWPRREVLPEQKAEIVNQTFSPRPHGGDGGRWHQ